MCSHYKRIPATHPRHYHRDPLSGQSERPSQCSASTHRSKTTGGVYCTRTYQRWTRHVWPQLTPCPGAQGRTGSHPPSGGGSTTSATFPQMAAHWRTYCLATGDNGLPPIYTIWANTTKFECQVAL